MKFLQQILVSQDREDPLVCRERAWLLVASGGQPQKRLVWTFSAELKHLFWKLGTRRQAWILVDTLEIPHFQDVNYLPTAAERSPADSGPSLQGRGCGPQAPVKQMLPFPLPCCLFCLFLLTSFLICYLYRHYHALDKLGHQFGKMWSFLGPLSTIFIPDPENGYWCQQDSKRWEYSTQNPSPRGTLSAPCCSSSFILPRLLVNCHTSL